MNTFYKTIAAAIQRRLAKTLDNELMNTQYGFRRDRSTKDALFVAKCMIAYAERAGMKGLMVLLDREKPFDKYRMSGFSSHQKASKSQKRF